MVQTATKTIHGHITKNLGSRHKRFLIFELLMLKHDRAYQSVGSEESMLYVCLCLIVKCNAVIRDSLLHSKR